MKKITGILLLGIILFSCFALFSCDLEKLWGGMTTTTSVTTTTTAKADPVDPSTLTFEHGDNFTEDDIEFVRSLHGKQRYWGSEPAISSIETVIDSMKYFTLYLTEIDIDSPYFVCAYLNNDTYYDTWKYDNYFIPLDVTQFVWYKFNELESLPQTIDNTSLVWIYACYDLMIIEDAIRSIDYNYQSRYYIEYENPKDITEIESMFTDSKILIFEDIEYPTRQESKFIDHDIYKYHSFSVYTNENGELYYLFLHELCDENENTICIYSEDSFGEYYDIASPYFTVINELTEDILTSTGKYEYRKYAGIKLDDFLNIQVTLNGSYILPNGIIVLVDEDIEAYMNGTLVFYDKDKVPVTE